MNQINLEIINETDKFGHPNLKNIYKFKKKEHKIKKISLM
jgi:hypothetical protein